MLRITRQHLAEPAFGIRVLLLPLGNRPQLEENRLIAWNPLVGGFEDALGFVKLVSLPVEIGEGDVGEWLIRGESPARSSAPTPPRPTPRSR